MRKFINRKHAGEQLAEKLLAYKNRNDVVILALPRGGVPVAYEIANKLHLPLDVFLVRKLGVPGHEELAMGAIAHGDVTNFNADILDYFHLSLEQIADVIASEKCELARRNMLYRRNQSPPDTSNKIVILVDDGIATGATMNAAITALRKTKPAKIIIATPVAAPDIYQQFSQQVDQFFCILTPESLYSVGMWYKEFPQTSDTEVIQLLQKASKFKIQLHDD